MDADTTGNQRWSRGRFLVPDRSFYWYVRRSVAGSATAVVVFGGILWHFHQRLERSLAAVDAATRELVVEASRQTLVASGLAALGGVLFLLLLGVYLVHRILGPVYRMKRELGSVLDGEPARPLRFRKDDQLGDFAELINELMRRTGAGGLADSRGSRPEAETRH